MEIQQGGGEQGWNRQPDFHQGL